MNYNFYLVDDDVSVLSILSKIIVNNNLGDVIGKSTDGETALFEIHGIKPDIVLVDLLLPKKDGISLVTEIKMVYPELPCIMISEVYAKEMVSKAYNNGVEFFVNKPINVIEVINVIKRVDEKIKMKRVIDSFQTAIQSIKTLSGDITSIDTYKESYVDEARHIFSHLGILSDAGTKDLTLMIAFIFDQNSSEKHEIFDHKLSDLYEYVSMKYEKEKGELVSSKAIEQRIRRAITQALRNIAEMGLHDYEHIAFERYASTLFDLSEVRKEMDFIKRLSKKSGKISIKKFLTGLIEELK